MKKINISQNNLYIDKIINIVKSEIPQNHKSLCVKSRHSDAFVYIISGSCTYRFDDGSKLTANAGDILYLAYQSIYTMYIHTSDYKFIFCDFNFISEYPRKSDVYTPQNTLTANILFFKLLDCFNFPSKRSFTESMAQLYRIYGTIQSISDKAYISKSADMRITEAKNYIDTKFKDNSLSISFLAGKAKMSEVYFRKLFKSKYNISPSQYITLVRLNNAKRIMRYPFISMSECAFQSGFSSVQYFCRVFKKETGMSPLKYSQNAEHF